MHPRTKELLAQLDEDREALRTAVDEVPAALRERRASPDAWSVAEVLEHLTLIENRILPFLVQGIGELRSRNAAPDSETSSVLGGIDRALVLDRSRRITAGEGVRPRGELDAASAWAALESARRSFREAVASSDGLPLREVTRKHPVLGPIDLYQWILFVAVHEARHTAQIREIGAALSAS
jgi:hypothetical protein